MTRASALQAWQTPEHRAWTPEEWATQPRPADDPEGEEEPCVEKSGPPAGPEASAAAAIADAAISMEVSAPAASTDAAVSKVTSAAAAIPDASVSMEASAVAAITGGTVVDRSSADAIAMQHAEVAGRTSSAGAAAAPGAAESVRTGTVEQPVVSTADDMDPVAHLAISDAATCDQLAAEAVAAEVTANEAAAATDPPAAQVAKAALASKALTVKERLAACVATERNRITFGKVNHASH